MKTFKPKHKTYFFGKSTQNACFFQIFQNVNKKFMFIKFFDYPQTNGNHFWWLFMSQQPHNGRGCTICSPHKYVICEMFNMDHIMVRKRMCTNFNDAEKKFPTTESPKTLQQASVGSYDLRKAYRVSGTRPPTFLDSRPTCGWGGPRTFSSEQAAKHLLPTIAPALSRKHGAAEFTRFARCYHVYLSCINATPLYASGIVMSSGSPRFDGARALCL